MTDFKNKAAAWFKKYLPFLIPIGVFFIAIFFGKERVTKSQINIAKTTVKEKEKIVDKQTEVVEDFGEKVKDDVEAITTILETQLDDKEARDEEAKKYFPDI